MALLGLITHQCCPAVAHDDDLFYVLIFLMYDINKGTLTINYKKIKIQRHYGESYIKWCAWCVRCYFLIHFLFIHSSSLSHLFCLIIPWSFIFSCHVESTLRIFRASCFVGLNLGVCYIPPISVRTFFVIACTVAMDTHFLSSTTVDQDIYPLILSRIPCMYNPPGKQSLGHPYI